MQRPLASSEVLVIKPWRWPSTIPRFTPAVHPRSSAFTIRFFNRPVPMYSYSFAARCQIVPLTVLPTNFSMCETRGR